jgi:mRNA-degrading endonuclease RelE of RelBE toxin-antitoxin system
MNEENIIQSMNIKKESTMLDYVKNNINYLVVFPDRKTKTYKTLGEIQKDICINSSTISKKLKIENGNIFKAKGGGYIFFIYKIN